MALAFRDQADTPGAVAARVFEGNVGELEGGKRANKSFTETRDRAVGKRDLQRVTFKIETPTAGLTGCFWYIKYRGCNTFNRNHGT